MKQLFIFFTLFALFSSADNYKDGETLYFQKGCNSCHGITGAGMNTYPKLSNMPKEYLIKKLLHYKNDVIKRMQANLMIPFAKPLSQKDIELISYFLSNWHEDKELERYDMEFESWGDGGS